MRQSDLSTSSLGFRPFSKRTDQKCQWETNKDSHRNFFFPVGNTNKDFDWILVEWCCPPDWKWGTPRKSNFKGCKVMHITNDATRDEYVNEATKQVKKLRRINPFAKISIHASYDTSPRAAHGTTLNRTMRGRRKDQRASYKVWNAAEETCCILEDLSFEPPTFCQKLLEGGFRKQVRLQARLSKNNLTWL